MKLQRSARPAATELTDLDTWGHWLVDHYNVDDQVIPGCWEAHGHIHEELTALHRAWLAAHTDTPGPRQPCAGTKPSHPPTHACATGAPASAAASRPTASHNHAAGAAATSKNPCETAGTPPCGAAQHRNDVSYSEVPPSR
jgi:hypothetical protein